MNEHSSQRIVRLLNLHCFCNCKKKSKFPKLPCNSDRMNLKRTYHAKEHRERSQPEHRKELGDLEKRRDYKERAKDYHQKQNALNQLKEKARLRNPDEFYFRMISTQTENGLHKEPTVTGPTLSAEQEKLIKTQDLAYVRQRIQRDQNRCNKITNLLTCAPPPTTTMVDQSTEKKKKIIFVEEELFNSNDQSTPSFTMTPSQELTKELNARRTRIQKLKQVEQQMKLKQDLSSKEAKFVIKTSSTGTPIYKWRMERKK